MDAKKHLPYNFTINTTIHPNNEIAVRMKKLFILLPFPAFHRWTAVKAAGLKCRSQVAGQVTGQFTGHISQVRSQATGQGTGQITGHVTGHTRKQ